MGTNTARATRVPRRLIETVAGLLVLALIAALVVFLLPREKKNMLTVDFDRTVSLYEGSKVRILGVDVGTVESITPRGSTVRVRLTWDAKYDVPADVSAVIVSPSVVGDRFIQLTPAYSGGATIAAGAHLDQSRTATPTELDETFAALDRVAVALGPEGANKDGALSNLLASSAENLDGKGAEIRRSITALSKLATTADGTKDELFSSMEKLDTFVKALEQNDASVRRFNSSLAGVSEVLAGERDDLTAALRELASALGQVQTYVAENRRSLRKNVDGLADVADTLAGERKNLRKILKQGPLALANLAAGYNPTTGTIDTRGSVRDPATDSYFLLTQPAYVTAYCGAAAEQNPKYTETCYAVGEVITWLGDSAPGAKTSSAAPGSAGDSGTGAPASSSDASDDLATMMGVAS
ncbi:MCE family protein [Mumia zhuanghuii]|uniref:MCE family protein n=1 Tax=Mumia zhuanghuii TaxID=2585211 RepID=A0A5C4MK89_9ACTN|nr:MCE family protein [Mumia zhuanghuii]TNC24730.1 MCE family protein [Mumia zhuanghuii]TNC45205.1 MCE family protein [Mumia zhuanghuii]